MRSGRATGVVLGIGTIAGVVLLLTRSRRASAANLGSPRERYTGRFPPLVERWRREVARRAKDLPVDAILEWIRIESGGDMCSVGGPTEVGIFQLMFPGDAKYGATLAVLRDICARSKVHDPSDISWLSEADLDAEVGAGIRKILAARETVRQVLGASGVSWPETSFDFGSAVKQIHATPAVITELVPKITHRDGAAPSSWADLRQKVATFPVAQMGAGLQKLWHTPSRHGLANRLEDTMQNAELVGRAWRSVGSPSVARA